MNAFTHVVPPKCFVVPSTKVISVRNLGTGKNLKCARHTAPLHRIHNYRVNYKRINDVRCCTESPAWKGPVDVDFAKDEQLEILEESLEHALQSEDFTKANLLQDKLLRLQSGSSVAVLSTNIKFYHALNNKSIVDIASCWYQSPTTTCKFPGGHLVAGYVNIINSFGLLFTYDLPRMDIRNCSIRMRGTVGYVTCDQVCFDEDGQQVVTCATNIYVKHNSQWYLHHHSSMIVSET